MSDELHDRGEVGLLLKLSHIVVWCWSMVCMRLEVSSEGTTKML